MNVFEKNIINIINSALEGKIPDLSGVLDFSYMYKFAKEQHLVGLIYYGLKDTKNVLKPNDFFELQHSFLILAAQSERQMLETEKITFALREESVEHMVLKGALLKKMYPHAEMRAMGDIDIFFVNPTDCSKISNLMTKLGYHEIPGSDHEYVWVKGDAIRVEFHRSLMSKKHLLFNKYYSNVHLCKCGNTSEYSMRPEDTFIYLFVHFTKHFEEGGAGVKFIVDLYLYMKKYDALDYTYISQEMKRLHICKFYKNIIKLIDVWFAGGEDNEITDFITDKLFAYGVFGNKENADAFEGVKAAETFPNAAVHKTMQLVFPGLSAMQIRYGILKKIPVLLPVMWIVRWLDLALFKRNRIKKQCSTINNMTGKKISAKTQELKYVGIDDIGGTK